MSCIKDIPCVEGGYMGGLSEIHIIPVRNVIKVPSCKCDSNHSISEPITLKDGTDFIKLNFRPQTARYRYNSRDDIHGGLFDVDVTLAIRKLRPEIDVNACKIRGRYILVFIDHNGYRRVAGTPESPMILESKGTTGTRRADRNGADWTFKGVSKCPLCYLAETVVFPNKTGSNTPPDPVLGDPTSSGGLDPYRKGRAVLEALGKQRLSGYFVSESGLPQGPATDLKVEFEYYNRKTGEVLAGPAELDYSSDINFGTAAAIGGTGAATYDAFRALYIDGGTGIHSDAAEADSGQFDIRLDKKLFSLITGNDDEDAVEIGVKIRTIDRLVSGKLTEGYFPIASLTAENIEFQLVNIAASSSGGGYSKDDLTFQFQAALNSAHFSIVPGTYYAEIDGNSKLGNSSDAWVDGSPSAGSGTVTNIAGTIDNPVFTFSNNSAHAFQVIVRTDVTDLVDTWTIECQFWVLRDDLDTDPMRAFAQIETTIWEHEVVDLSDDISVKVGFLAENGEFGEVATLEGGYSEATGLGQTDNPATVQDVVLEADVNDMNAFTITASMSGFAGTGVPDDATAHSQSFVRLKRI